jgi:hypothetical protein
MMERRLTIPEIRDELIAIAADLHPVVGDRIRALALETKRRSPVRRARITARKVTPELADEVEAFAARNPRLRMSEIGRRFGIDGGRVSEILAGKRGEP